MTGFRDCPRGTAGRGFRPRHVFGQTIGLCAVGGAPKGGLLAEGAEKPDNDPVSHSPAAARLRRPRIVTSAAETIASITAAAPKRPPRDLCESSPSRVTMALIRLEQGNFGDSKSVGDGVVERRITVGPGYRVYFGRDGAILVILLGGGTKQRPDRDIETAKRRWNDSQRRKQGLDAKTWH